MKANGREEDASTYLQWTGILASVQTGDRSVIDHQLLELRIKHETAGLITKQHQASRLLAEQVDESQHWARRYNPIRLGLEHASLRTEVVNRQGTDPSLPAIAVKNPHTCDIGPADSVAYLAHESFVASRLKSLGVSEMILVRGLDICEFSFGFTRVGSTPSITVKDMEMPVRLRAFDYVERGKRPIYIMEQKNEAFYVRLDETRVIAWLEANATPDLPPREKMRLGGLLIEQYADFGRFLENYKERTAESRTPRSLPSYVYLLLHSVAHHFAHAVIEYSGLEHGSLGEYIFPADLEPPSIGV